MNNTDKLVTHILDNVKTLEPEKIRALADVVRALGGEVEKNPNEMSVLPDDTNMLDEEQPIDMTNVTSVVVDGKKSPVKIISN